MKIAEMTQEQKRAKWREYYRKHTSQYRECHRRYANKRYREDEEFRERTKKSNLERYYERKEGRK